MKNSRRNSYSKYAYWYEPKYFTFANLPSPIDEVPTRLEVQSLVGQKKFIAFSEPDGDEVGFLDTEIEEHEAEEHDSAPHWECEEQDPIYA